MERPNNWLKRPFFGKFNGPEKVSMISLLVNGPIVIKITCKNHSSMPSNYFIFRKGLWWIVNLGPERNLHDRGAFTSPS